MPEEKEMKVVLLSRTQHPKDLIYAAFRQCYRNGFVGDSWDGILTGNVANEEDKDKLIRNVIASGHESPIEHVSFTFAIDGVTRELSHQLVRHRIASYSQQSQRYTGKGDFGIVVPPSINNDRVAREKFLNLTKEIEDTFDDISEMLENNGDKKAAKEDARSVLPNAAVTRIVVTMNCRSLLNFFKLRCCNRAQWQIRDLANTMLGICKNELPIVFENAGPKCKQLGYCPEGKFSCKNE